MNITKARRPIAVVDERTHRHATRALDLLMTSGEDTDLVKAPPSATRQSCGCATRSAPAASPGAPGGPRGWSSGS
jgi:hypothetical protein